MIHTCFLSASKWISLSPPADSFCIIFIMRVFVNISVTSKHWDLISQWLRPLHFKSHFPFYQTFIKMAQENELVKRFFHLFHRNNIQHQCYVARQPGDLKLESISALRFLQISHTYACPAESPRLHDLYSSIYCKSFRFIIDTYVTLLV